MRLGFVYDISPEPLDAERTRFVEAGAIRVGVELRAIDDASLRASFAAEAGLAARLEVRMTVNGQSLTGSAYYKDRFRRERGSWRFSERRCPFLHLVPIQRGWAGPADAADARAR